MNNAGHNKEPDKFAAEVIELNEKAKKEYRIFITSKEETPEAIELQMLSQKRAYRRFFWIVALTIGSFYSCAIFFAGYMIWVKIQYAPLSLFLDIPKGWLIFFSTLCIVPTVLTMSFAKFLFSEIKKDDKKEDEMIESIIEKVLKAIPHLNK